MESQILKTEKLVVSYDGVNNTIKGVNVGISKNHITAIMGPSGCGKTTLLRCFNRMHELVGNVVTTGSIFLHNQNILAMDPIMVRRMIGMVFQRPNPFPTMNIYDNVISGYKLNGIRKSKAEFDEIVETSLRKVALWDEVKDGLFRRGTFLSGGQQQRLCIARALAMKPEIILLDEPTSALDPIATQRIEELLIELKKGVTILIVTHNIGQAGRIADDTAFLYLGELIEFGATEKLFTNPQNEKTEKFLSGQFG